MEAYRKDKRTGAGALLRLKSNTNRMLISILIGNNLVNIGASAMATVLAAEKFGHLGPGLAVGVLTLLVLIFGEITPKTFAARYAGRISLLVAPPLLVFTRLVFPLVWTLEQLTEYLQGLSKLSQDPTVTEFELLSMAEHGAEEGTIERQDQEMIERIFAFNDLRARDVMIPSTSPVHLGWRSYGWPGFAGDRSSSIHEDSLEYRLIQKDHPRSHYA